MSGLSEQRGVVRRIEGGRAVVAVAGAACGGCAHAGGCVAGRLATPAAHLLTLPADAALAVGDEVRLTQPERSVTLSALLGYLFPALALLVGAWLGATLTGSDAGAAVGAASGFLLALALARLLLATLPGLLPPPRAVPLSRSATLSSQEYPDEP